MSNEKQSTDTVLMVSPDAFAFNTQTADTNAFQGNTIISQLKEKALVEFEQMVAQLRAANIRVITLKSPDEKQAPDAIFPNNWFTTHRTSEGGVLILYPMLAPNRRLERQHEALKFALVNHGVPIHQEIDLSFYEEQGKYLEGTGSVILDRVNQVGYAAISPRTDEVVLHELAKNLGIKTVVFHSYDKRGLIYHTNVMLSIGTKFAVIAAVSIRDATERQKVLASLYESGREILEITLEQMENMCGNILEVQSRTGQTKIVMSQTAYHAFTTAQKQSLQKMGDIVVVTIPTIETVGGGSARCMMAEIF